MKDWQIITIIIILILLILTILTSLICYLMAFYSGNKKHQSNEIILPNNEIYDSFRNLIMSNSHCNLSIINILLSII